MLPSFIESVKVISLVRSTDRRSRIGRHLKETLKLEQFEYHDAKGPDHPDVRRLFESGLVQRFPPCFRCGKLECGNDECNNVLTGGLVANFATYLDLWRNIAASGKVTLVLEDDVVIHPWARRVLARLDRDVSRGRIDMSREQPRLLRLGWALGPEHKRWARYRTNEDVRMSNPAQVLTPGYARALIERFEMINQTSDVFAHKIAVRPGEATTVFPPIASDLSWSTGEVESTLHPKQIRAQWLEKHGTPEEAERHRALANSQVGHMFHRPVLITGHPRCGTGFAAALCRQVGLDVGHEDDGRHGLSSWMMAADADENPWALSPVARRRRALHWDVLIHVVRDLQSAIPSVMRENEHAGESFEFRRKHILASFGCDIAEFPSPVERAARSLVYWNRMVRELNPDIVLRLGGDVHDFVAQLRFHGLPVVEPASLDLSPVNKDKKYRGKQFPLPVVTAADWRDVGNETKEMLREEARIIGCQLPFVFQSETRSGTPAKTDMKPDR
ncbi:MAG TPA: hypothetical protein ENJ26_00525 [Rhodobacteraceae bacterium]|nr:hypothetical protein [Paracoccaceae bacterium]